MFDNIEKPLKLYCDKEPAVMYTHNNQSSGAAKHIDLKYFVVKDKSLESHNKSRAHKKDARGSAKERRTTHLVHGTYSAHGFKGSLMILDEGPKSKSKSICF